MGDTVVTIVAIMLAATLMFGFPLMTMADRADDVSQLSVQAETTKFVDDVKTTGTISLDKYAKFSEAIHATGNAYDVEMEIKVLDENPGKKVTQAQADKIGENVGYSLYTSQIMDEITDENGNSRKYSLKEGDYFAVKVKNTNVTISQQLKNFFYKVTGNDSYAVAAEDSGMVTAHGKK